MKKKFPNMMILPLVQTLIYTSGKKNLKYGGYQVAEENKSCHGFHTQAHPAWEQKHMQLPGKPRITENKLVFDTQALETYSNK